MGEAKRRKQLDPSWGTSKAKDSSYYEEFQAALARTERFGLSTPRVSYVKGRFLTDKALKRMNRVILEKFGVLTPEQVAHQCLAFNLKLVEPLSEFFNQPVIFTIGHIFAPPEYLYLKTEDQLRKLMDEGTSRSTIDIHAWLTLPSMEIIDSTIATSFYVTKRIGVPFGVIARHADELTGVSYHPMLVGDGFLRKAGVLVEI